jgi:hypothetical protein
VLLRFLILDCRSSVRSGNAFAVSAKHCDSGCTRKRNTAITRAGFDFLANSTTAHRRAFQKFESALDWPSSDGRAGLGYCD